MSELECVGTGLVLLLLFFIARDAFRSDDEPWGDDSGGEF